VNSVNNTTDFVDIIETGEERIFRNRRRVTIACSRLPRFIVLALIALIFISGVKNDSADKDNDDYGVNEPYDGDGEYYYPKQEEYKNETEYKYDWEVFERFSLNYGSANELSVIINCTDVHNDMNKDVVIPDEKSWKLMNKVYRSTMIKHRTDEKKYDVFPPAFRSALSAAAEVRIAPGEGRGIFATNDIAEGSVVWKSTNTAEFRSGDAFRNFVLELSTHDKRVACDAMNWSYVVKASSAEYTICIDLDEGGMFNDGMGNAGDTNVGGINRDVEYGCNGRSLYTSRNIPAGTQLKVDYGSFVQQKWNILGVCSWGPIPPLPGCETAAKITYLKDDGIRERVGFEYEDEFSDV